MAKKQSAFLAKINAVHEQKMKCQRLFTMQQCEDVMMLALNEVFSAGPEMTERFKMEGKIVIEVSRDGRMMMDMRIAKVSMGDKMTLIDGLCSALKLSPGEKALAGLVVTRGIEVLPGFSRKEYTEMSVEVADFLKNKVEGCEPPENKL